MKWHPPPFPVSLLPNAQDGSRMESNRKLLYMTHRSLPVDFWETGLPILSKDGSRTRPRVMLWCFTQSSWKQWRNLWEPWKSRRWNGMEQDCGSPKWSHEWTKNGHCRPWGWKAKKLVRTWQILYRAFTQQYHDAQFISYRPNYPTAQAAILLGWHLVGSPTIKYMPKNE